ncbi:hypothetical protein [Flaviaesturariibacter aridisoli]|uniref:ABC transporter ATPase n=1 Tax=Flaviaesturariibacter aridisoli TaxID=2545761 RepID=A0A4V2WN24_9BACT|nr:hypothetical protein [Flaviaesturariibacter aridisoli]TCZ73842.1 hypothetical protein E0486_03945 [Flaviaesturariibacter aridisoli]
MNLDFHQHLPEDFAPESRVWIYQSNRLLFLSEALELEPMLEAFLAEWRSHGAKVKCWGTLLFGQFLVLMADETAAGVSGCSTDSSVRFVKQAGEKFNVDFFNRTHLAFFVKEKIQTIPLSQLQPALTAGLVGPDTLYFNNTVASKAELEANWIVPVKESWIAGRFALSNQ